MKICIAQTRPIKGNVSANIEAHELFIEHALTLNAEAIFFSELSLTGYEPALAKELATTENNIRLEIFQHISNHSNIIIGLGLPTATESRIRISMIIFQPNKQREIYSKQQLHSDEITYFESGIEQKIINSNATKIAPAICYESLHPSHIENANKLGANVYLASVAKPAKGLEKAFKHFSEIAKQYETPVLMVNSVGFCDNFLSVGQSAVWSKEGKLLGQLDDKTEGVLIFDTETETAVQKISNRY